MTHPLLSDGTPPVLRTLVKSHVDHAQTDTSVSVVTKCASVRHGMGRGKQAIVT